MCDAAVAETLIESLNILYKINPADATFYSVFPKGSWSFRSDTGLLAYIGEWRVENCTKTKHFDLSTGAADALQQFGLGKVDKFENLGPGDLIRFEHGEHGHSAIFLGYIDAQHKVQASFGAAKKVVGFQYFSSQESTDGLGIRSAYFSSESCGIAISPATATDCKGERGAVIRYSIVAGHMLSPQNWTIEQAKKDRLKSLIDHQIICPPASNLQPSQLKFLKDLEGLSVKTGTRSLIPFVKSLNNDQRANLLREFHSKGYDERIDVPGLQAETAKISEEALSNLVAQSLRMELEKDFVGHRRIPAD